MPSSYTNIKLSVESTSICCSSEVSEFVKSQNTSFANVVQDNVNETESLSKMIFCCLSPCRRPIPTLNYPLKVPQYVVVVKSVNLSRIKIQALQMFFKIM